MTLALLLAPAAAGAWGVAGSGGGAGRAASMPAGAVPTAFAALTSVAVSWSAATVGGTPVTGYRVRRYATVGGAESAVAGTCAGVVAATACTDSGVSLGSWRYTVTPVQHAWLGAESAQSLPVVVP